MVSLVLTYTIFVQEAFDEDEKFRTDDLFAQVNNSRNLLNHKKDKASKFPSRSPAGDSIGKLRKDMSLGSLVANLFSGSTSRTQQVRNEFEFADDGLSEGKPTFADTKFGSGGFRSETMASKEDEEEGRPPYVHVRWN